ncbi:MAG: ABC transporter ATP-binding protein, partial [Lentisphaeria bacterium]
MPSTNVPVLSVKNLQIQFNHVPVVRGVSFDLYPGEIFALVGESGSGKSVTALSIMGLLNSIPGAAVQGTITFNQQNLVNCSEESYQKLRGNHISMIFQEPMTALNPVFSIGFQIAEVLKKHQHQKGKELYADIIELLQFVGIPSPEQCYKNYPHQLSGGMRQRVMIAIALACRPQLLIADEPTTALDVTVQAQIMKLIDSLRKKYNTAVLFITHNLALISQYADQCVVMYSGCMMEQAPANLFFTAPRHPYTKMLLQAMPQNAMKGTKLMAIDGVVPGPECELPGCRFASRCPLAMPICRKKRPAMRQIGENHFACCHCLESVLSDLLKKDAAPTAVPEFEKKEPLLCVEDLQVEFPICKGLFKRKIGAVKAVNHID